MNKKTIFIILTLLSFILGSGAIGYLYYYTNPIKNNRPDLSDSKYFIAHATGSICGYTYLNSKESLINSLENGLGSDFDLVYTDNWNLKTQLNNYQDHTTR